jgi:hypothetical protein
MTAGRTVADRCDLLLAVWDGQPAAGLGGPPTSCPTPLTAASPSRLSGRKAPAAPEA